MRRAFFGEGVRRKSIEAARVGPGMVVADVGTGTGFLAELALDAGADVIGIDISGGILAQVTARFAGRHFEARQGDTAALTLHAGEVDAVLGNLVCTTPRIRLRPSGKWRGRSSRAAHSSSPTLIATRTNGCGPNSTISGSASRAPTSVARSHSNVLNFESSKVLKFENSSWAETWSRLWSRSPHLIIRPVLCTWALHGWSEWPLYCQQTRAPRPHSHRIRARTGFPTIAAIAFWSDLGRPRSRLGGSSVSTTESAGVGDFLLALFMTEDLCTFERLNVRTLER
jgi:hypothetical protein